MKRLVCWLIGIVETLRPPVFPVSGHIWPDELDWSEPRSSPDPAAWNGLVQYQRARCQRCGAELDNGWRRYWGVA